MIKIEDRPRTDKPRDPLLTSEIPIDAFTGKWERIVVLVILLAGLILLVGSVLLCF